MTSVHVRAVSFIKVASIKSVNPGGMRRGVDFKWFDGFFLSMLATSVIVVSVSWDRYSTCTHPLHIWIVVDYTTVFVFRILMFVDNGVAAGMGLDSSQLERTIQFKCRIVVLSILAFLLYPFLCAWTVVGSIWFTSTQGCLPEEGQKWGFLIWLVFSYCGLLCIGCVSTGKWLLRRQFHVQVNPGNLVSGPLSGFQVLVELIRLPEWAIHASTPIEDFSARAGRDPISYHSGPCLTRSQRERVERAIQQLPKFRFKSVSTENSSCPICLDDFEVGTEVRGLPCAHNFHSACIDKWLRLNMKCPHCRCSVFPDLDLTEAVLPGQPTVVNGLEGNEDGIIIVTVPANHLARAQSVSAQRTPNRLEDLLRLSLTDNQHQHPMAPQGLLEQYELSRTGQAEIGFGGLQEVPEVSSREEATSLRLEPGAPIQANEGASEGGSPETRS